MAWLRRRGYEIRERNWQVKAGEIDVIALDGDTLCFIEIKARAGRTFGSAVAAVTPLKQHRIASAASLFLASSGWTGPCRFDVLGLEAGREAGWDFVLIRNAFEAASR